MSALRPSTPVVSARPDARKFAEPIPGPQGPVPSGLDQPGHNCQARDPKGADPGGGIADAVAALLGREREPHELEWWGDLETIWRIRRAPHIERLKRRACRLWAEAAAMDCPFSRAELSRRAAWAEGRAQSQAMSREHKISTCRRRWISFRCGCQTIERPVGCDSTTLCDWCRKRHMRRWRRRITKALGAQQRARHAAWRHQGKPRGREPLVYLITLTIGHSGDVDVDRGELWAAWRAWQKWMTAEVGGSFHYAATWEVTEGEDGRGHVHCHIGAVLPWFDYAAAGEAWKKCSPRSSNAGIDFTRSRAESASKYLSKYVTKGVQLGVLPGVMAGEVIASWYGRRKVSTSRHFWRPLLARGKACCRRCAREWLVHERPPPLSRVAPESVWFATAELASVRLPRGPTQVRLRFDIPADLEPPKRGSGHYQRQG